MKATSVKSYLKKSEAYSSTLPATEKKLIPNGQVMQVSKSQANKPALVDGYYVVALA